MIYILARVTGQPRRYSVAPDGTIRVFDSRAGYYTALHTLTKRQAARILSIAEGRNA